MSGIEIERKYLVRQGSVAYRSAAFACRHILQGYIPADGATVRVRVVDDEAFLTIKSHSVDGGLSRYEFEHRITTDEARNLLRLCKGGFIDKHRYLVQSDRHVVEVDEFHGRNEGLVVAEIEFNSKEETVVLPDFIGEEVTYDRRFSNASLLIHPYSEWQSDSKSAQE